MKSYMIRTKTAEQSRIVCREGVLRTALPRLLSEYREVFFFSDRTVWELYGRKIGRAYRESPVHIMPAGEAHKTPETLFKLLAAMAEAQLHRGACLVCLGGGVVGDVGGLAAALYMRGIDCIQIPTTLLAQVDSSVGGKTAVDFAGVKNLIGAFRQPRYVFADPTFFATLPPREVRCGLGEIVKHGALHAPLFDMLWENRGRLTDGDFLAAIVPENIAFKAEVVRQDADEKGLRKCLNLGHTTAHAFELTDGKLSHGEYVLVGMIFEAELAKKFAGGDAAYLDDLEDLCRIALGSVPALPPAREAARLARLDKKNAVSDEVVLTVPVRKGEYTLLSLGFDVYAAELERIQRALTEGGAAC